jgi:prophage regulatory protein
MTQTLTLTVQEVAQLLGRGVRTIWRWTEKGKFPKPIKIEGSTLWRRADIELFVQEGSFKAFRQAKRGG